MEKRCPKKVAINAIKKITKFPDNFSLQNSFFNLLVNIVKNILSYYLYNKKLFIIICT